MSSENNYRLANDKVEDLSIIVDYKDFEDRNYSFSAGQYFDVKMECSDISNEEFNNILNNLKDEIQCISNDRIAYESKVNESFDKVKYDGTL